MVVMVVLEMVMEIVKVAKMMLIVTSRRGCAGGSKGYW